MKWPGGRVTDDRPRFHKIPHIYTARNPCEADYCRHHLLRQNAGRSVQIPKECGFAHQSHFTSRFKQAAGFTPTRWRKMALARRAVSDN